MIVGEITYGGPNTDPLLCIIRVYSRDMTAVGLNAAYLVWDGTDNAAPQVTTELLQASVWPAASNAQRDKNRIRANPHYDTFPNTLLPEDARFSVQTVERECNKTSQGRYVVCCDQEREDETDGLLRRTYLRMDEGDAFFGRRISYGLATTEYASQYAQRSGAINAMRSAHAQGHLERILTVAPLNVERARENCLAEALRRNLMPEHGGFVLRCPSDTAGRLAEWHGTGSFTPESAIYNPVRDLNQAVIYSDWEEARNAQLRIYDRHRRYTRIQSRMDAYLDFHRYPSRSYEPIDGPRPNNEAGQYSPPEPVARIPTQAITVADPRNPQLPVQHGFGPRPPPAPSIPAPPEVRPPTNTADMMIEELQQLTRDLDETREALPRETVRARSRDRVLTPEEQQAITFGDYVRIIRTPFIHLIIGMHLDELIGLRCHEREPEAGGVTPLVLQNNTLRIIPRTEICWTSRQPAVPTGDHRNISLDES